MRRSRLGALGALSAVIMVAVTTGVAPAASPSATGSQAFVSGTPAAIACGGSVDARVTVNGQAGSTGASTDVMLVLDLSGSTGTPPSKLADLKRAAIDALDRARCVPTGRRISRSPATPRASSTTADVGRDHPRAARLDVRHAGRRREQPARARPAAARTARASAPRARRSQRAPSGYANVDGPDRRWPRERRREVASGTSAATTAKANGDRILAVGIGADASQATLSSWASQTGYYQSGTPARSTRPSSSPISARPSRFRSASRSPRRSGRTSRRPRSAPRPARSRRAPGSLVWTGTINGSGSATLVYRATRNGSERLRSDQRARQHDEPRRHRRHRHGDATGVALHRRPGLRLDPARDDDLHRVGVLRERLPGRRAVLGERRRAAGRDRAVAELAERTRRRPRPAPASSRTRRAPSSPCGRSRRTRTSASSSRGRRWGTSGGSRRTSVSAPTCASSRRSSRSRISSRTRPSSPAARCRAAGGASCPPSRGSRGSRAAASCSGRTSRAARRTRPATP